MTKVKITQANILLLIVVVLLSVLPLFTQILVQKVYNYDISDLMRLNDMTKTISLLIDQYVLIFIPIIIFSVINKLKVKDVFRLRPVNLSASVLTVVAAAAAWFISAFVSIIIYQIYAKIFGPPSNTVEDMLPSNMLLGLFLVALTPAICEEALFRGITLKAYENRGTFKAIFISALLFASIHFSVVRFAGPFIIGLLAAYLVIRTNSIIPGMLTHFTFNGISLLLFYANKDNLQNSVPVLALPQYIALFVLAVLALYVLGACILGITTITSPQKNKSSERHFLYRLFFGAPKQQVVFNKSIASLRQDLVSILSNWPIIVIVILLIVINILEMLSSSVK